MHVIVMPLMIEIASMHVPLMAVAPSPSEKTLFILQFGWALSDHGSSMVSKHARKP